GAYLVDARAALDELNQDMREAEALVRSQPDLVALQQGIRETTEIIDEFNSVVDATEQTVVRLTETRTRLEAAAEAFTTSSAEYIGNQNRSMQEEIGKGIAAEALNERRQKLIMAEEILDAGNRARLANFKSQALRDLG